MNEIVPKRTITVGAREANQQFSKLLREVEGGAEVVITRNGVEVARLNLIPHEVDAEHRKRDAADMMEFMRKNAGNSGGYKFNREDAYEEIHERYDRHRKT